MLDHPRTGSDANRRSHTVCRILVGYDGSGEAQEALRVGTSLATELGADLRVLVVVRPPAHAETPEELERAEAAERANLSAGLVTDPPPGQPALDLDVRVVFADDPATTLARHATEHGFDLVVVGRHGRDRMMHRGIGHTLDALLRHSSIAVLVT